MDDSWRKRARQRMKDVGETQNSLSEKLGMTQGGLQHWLAGTRQPALEDINRIAAELQCSPVWLTHGVGQPTDLAWYTPPAALPPSAAGAVVMPLPAKTPADCYWPFSTPAERVKAALQPDQLAALDAMLLALIEKSERESQQARSKNRRLASGGQA